MVMTTLRLFAAAREAAGTGSVVVTGATVGDVLDQACDRYGAEFVAVLATAKVWCNGDPVDRSHVGSVASIEPIHERPEGSGAGAVIGGVLGAVVGNQFGHGAGRAGMTGVGAVGGAIAGNNLERNHREAITGYRVSIRLDNGSTRSFQRTQIGALHVGDRVRLDAGTFRRV